MGFGAESPGNIRNQLGRSLNMIRLNIEQEDIEGLANHTRFLVTLCHPYLDQEQDYTFKGTPGNDPAKVFDRSMEIIQQVLNNMSQRGVYAWIEGEIGDAAELAL